MERPAAFSTAPTGAAAIARDARSIVIAWASGSPARISVARLDETLRVIDGTQHDLPAQSGSDYDAAYPQLAVVEGNPALLWRERQRVPGKAPVYLFMARLSPGLEPTVQWSGAVSDASLTAIDAGDDGAVRIAFEPVIVTVDRAGNASMKQALTGAIALALGDGHGAWATATRSGGVPCGCGFGMICACPPAVWNVTAFLDGRSAMSFQLPATGTPIQPGGVAIATDGTSCAAPVLAADGSVFINRVNGYVGEKTLTVGSYAERQPVVASVATDGEHWIVVWQTLVATAPGREIRGVSFSMDDDRFETFTIAPAGADVQMPIVTAIAPGLFVVAYEIENDDTHRQLAGRYVTFLPPHHRPGAK